MSVISAKGSEKVQKGKSGRSRDDSGPYPFVDLFDLRTYTGAVHILSLDAMLRRLERKTGIKASPHMLRHYFANARRKDGWKLEMISQALGHRNIETTMKYLNITEDELIEVSDAFYNR